VPGENLTRLEAQERAAFLAVESYAVDLDLTTGPETFRSSTTVRFTADGGTTTFIDAITSKVHSVTLNGAELDPASVSDGLRIQLDRLQAQNELTVVGDFAYTNTGEGLHRFVDPVDQEVYLYSQFEVPDSRRVFAVFEQPDLKATFQFTVTAPADWALVSNSPTPEPVAVSTGTTSAATWTFEPTPRIPATSPRSSPDRTSRSTPSSPARAAASSRSASMRASRCSSTSTPTTSSTSPARASSTTRRSSATRTRSPSTTSSSCPSSTRAPWRTPEPSRSPRPTCSARR